MSPLLKTPKKYSPADQFIFQRRTSTPTGSSGHDESSSLYAQLGLTGSEVESDEDVPGMDAGVQDEGQARPNPGEQDEGQAGLNPGDAAASQPQSSLVVHAGPNLKHTDLKIDESMELSRFLLGLMSGCVWRAFFPVFNSSPARFELHVVGRPSRFASSRPAKKVKGSGQRVGGRCRTARERSGHENASARIKQKVRTFEDERENAPQGTLEDVYKNVFADSYQHGTDSEKEEAWHEIGGGRIFDSELLDSMDGGRALQLKHEINVESTIIQRGTTKRDRDQPLEEFQPLLPLGRVSLLSKLARCKDQLINMNLESGWLIAASLSWRLSGRGGACYRNLFPGVCEGDELLFVRS
nr:hypothetical protein [Tanacetum cinerariifolium]